MQTKILSSCSGSLRIKEERKGKYSVKIDLLNHFILDCLLAVDSKIVVDMNMKGSGSRIFVLL